MAYTITPAGSVSHTATLLANSDSGFTPGNTITWYNDAVAFKTGLVDDTDNLEAGPFSATETGAVIHFEIGLASSNNVTLTNVAPTITAVLSEISGVSSINPSFSSVTYADADNDPLYAYKITLGTTPGGTELYNSGDVLAGNTVTLPTLTNALTFYWRYFVSDGEGAPAYSYVYDSGSSVTNSLPVVSAVQINGTTGGSNVDSQYPTFSWTYTDADAQAQTYYQIQVAVDNLFTSTSIIWDSEELFGADTSYTYPSTATALVPGTYYVRIKAKDAFEWGTWSTTESWVAISDPVITSVMVNSKINPLNVSSKTNPVFSWQETNWANYGIVSFEIRVADNNTNLGTNSFVGNKLEYSTACESCFEYEYSGTSLSTSIRYYWQVRCSTLLSTSAWVTGFFEINSVPVVSDLTILPSPAYKASDLTCRYTFTSNGTESPLTVIKWYLKASGETVYTEVESLRQSKSVPKSLLHGGDKWKFSVTPHDGIDVGSTVTSSSTTIINQLPVASALILSPTAPTTSDKLTASFTLSDLDGDNVTATIHWYKNNDEQPLLLNELMVPASMTTANDEWYFTVTPNDGEDDGEIATSWTITVLNTPPEILSLTVDSKILPKTLKNANPTISWNYSDSDGQTQTHYQVVIGTKPAKVNENSALTTRGKTFGIGSDVDGIVSVAQSGTLVTGNEIYDSGIVESANPFFQYRTDDFKTSYIMGKDELTSLNNYKIGQDLVFSLVSPGTGTATGTFNGDNGLYDLEMTYLKNQTTATFDILVNGVNAGTKITETGNSLDFISFKSISLNKGDILSIRGTTKDNGSMAQFNNIRFKSISLLELKTGDFTTLSGYLKDGTGGIKLAAAIGSASTTFNFPTGTYNIELTYVTETTGTPSLILYKNATTLLSFTYETGARTRTRLISNVSITNGDTIKLTGTKNASAVARVKSLIFKPITTTDTGAKLKNGLLYYSSVRVSDGEDWSNWYTTQFILDGTAWENVSNAQGWTVDFGVKLI